MLIIGAGGLVRQSIELIEVACSDTSSLIFYDDTSTAPELVFNKYQVIHSLKEAADHFQNKDRHFSICVSAPFARMTLYQKFQQIGGTPFSLLSNSSKYGKYNCSIGEGALILSDCLIESNTSIGLGSLLNIKVSVTHDSVIGQFCELGPGVIICGNVRVGNNCFIGAGAIVLPHIVIEDEAVIGAGAVVNKNVGKGERIVGVPGKSI